MTVYKSTGEPIKVPGREVIAARQLVEEWKRKIGEIQFAQFDTPREAYHAFAEWLFQKSGGYSEITSGSFEMEVFRRTLPRYDIFQMILAYLPRQQRVPEVSK